LNVLLIYPRFPDTYWSFRHALSFLGKRAAQPPLGLMTVAALLPASWQKRLIDTNVERLKDADLAWAEVALVSGMHVQLEHLLEVVERCRACGLRTVVGGPIASSVSATSLKADHVVIGEAEDLIATLVRDLEAGEVRPVYEAAEKPAMQRSPLPDLSLIKMNRYSTMTVQYSRGCPYNIVSGCWTMPNQNFHLDSRVAETSDDKNSLRLCLFNIAHSGGKIDGCRPAQSPSNLISAKAAVEPAMPRSPAPL
jgi:radical SAM superfamily enzyme YgiQ (UPF0313 family)